MLKKRNLKKRVMSILLIVSMIVAILPTNSVQIPIFAADDVYKTVEVEGKKIYFYGAESVEEPVESQDQATYEIAYTGTEETALAIYVGGAEETVDSVDVNFEVDKVTISKSWLEQQDEWIAVKCTATSEVPSEEPVAELPKVKATVTAYNAKYDEKEHEAVIVEIVDKTDSDVISYSTDGGTTWVGEDDKPMIKLPGTQKVMVKVERDGWQTYESEEIEAKVDKGDIKATVTPFNEAYNPNDTSAKKAVEVIVEGNDEFKKEYSLDNGLTWQEDVPTIALPEEKNITVKITSENYNDYETTVTAKMTPATIEGITVEPYSGTYDKEAHDVVKSIDGLKKGDEVSYSETSETEGFSDEMPQITDAGEKTFWVRIKREHHDEYITIPAMIAKVDKAEITGVEVKKYDGTVYDSIEHQAIESITGYLDSDIVTYSVDKKEWKEDSSELVVKEAGDYEYYVKVVRDSNYKELEITVNISIGESEQKIELSFDESVDGGKAVYKEDNKIVCNVDRPDDATGKISFSLEDGKDIATIDENTGEIEFTGVGKVRVKVTAEDDNNYAPAEDSEEFSIVYATLPDRTEYTVSAPSYKYENYSWYDANNNVFEITAPSGWLVRAGSNDNNLENAAEWMKSITVESEGEYKDYQVAFKNENTTGITDLIDVEDFAIDTTNPKIDRFTFVDINTLSPIANALTFGFFKNEAVKVKVEASDSATSSGISEIKLYKYSTADAFLAEVEPVKDEEFNDGEAIFIIDPYFEGTLRAEVIDNVGRTSGSIDSEAGPILATTSNSNIGTSEVEGYIMLETDTPEVKNMADVPLNDSVRKVIINEKIIYSGNISFSFDATDYVEEILMEENPDNEKAKMYLHGSGINTTLVKINDFIAIEKNDYEPQYVGEDKYTVTTEPDEVVAKEDGTFTFYVNVTDNAGNVTEKTRTVYVDRTYPIITGFEFNLDENIDVEETNGAFDAVVSTDYGFYFKKDVKVTISAKDLKAVNETASGVDTITYKAVDINGNTVYEGTEAVTDNKIEFEIKENFKGQIFAYATDKVGNTPVNSTKPADDILPADYDVKSMDANGYVHPNGSVIEKTDKHTETSAIEFTMPKASGKQSNTSSYKYDGEGIADKNMDYKTSANVPLYASDINVGVKVTDSYSGIKEVKWTVIEGDVSIKKVITVDNAGKLDGDITGWTATKDENSNLVTSIENTNMTISGNYNDMVILVELTDRAGNKSYDYYVFGIDKTAPTIEVSYDNNSGDSKAKDGSAYFKAKRVATITVTERNFNSEAVKESIKQDKINYPVVLTWKKVNGTGNGDDTKYVAKVTYDEDGDYTFDISLKDRAKNNNKAVDYGKSVAPTKFTVDLTNPVIAVTYDNNSAQNSKYFKEERTATIVVTEHNFTEGRITYTRTSRLDGRRIQNPVVSKWSKKGNNYTATITYVADGDYTFDVTVTDKAGNKDQGADYGTSVAPKDFTVDKTIEEPVITGAEDGKSYKDEIIPVIRFSDVNFDSREIKLTRTRKNEKDVDVTDELITSVRMGAQGGTITSDTFDKIAENDGIYTLSLKMTDKAGNESTESITFTVNRFGSVYAFNDYLISLQDSYVQKIDKDIVITEYNPNRLVANSLKIQITRDGTPISDVKYTVNPIVNNRVKIGESGWYQYEYVIEPSNFSEDGIYKIAISSEDAVGNKPETANYEDCNVLFMVDTTAAEITNITGLEKAIVNAEELNINLEVFDAIGLKSITVYRNGAAIETFDTLEDLINFKGSFVLGEGSNQNIEIVVEDLAGNKLSTSSESFQPEYEFNDKVTISTNMFVRWFANKWLFWGTIALLVLAAGGIIFFILMKKKKEDEEEATTQA